MDLLLLAPIWNPCSSGVAWTTTQVSRHSCRCAERFHCCVLAPNIAQSESEGGSHQPLLQMALTRCVKSTHWHRGVLPRDCLGTLLENRGRQNRKATLMFLSSGGRPKAFVPSRAAPVGGEYDEEHGLVKPRPVLVLDAVAAERAPRLYVASLAIESR